MLKALDLDIRFQLKETLDYLAIDALGKELEGGSVKPEFYKALYKGYKILYLMHP